MMDILDQLDSAPVRFQGRHDQRHGRHEWRHTRRGSCANSRPALKPNQPTEIADNLFVTCAKKSA